MNKKLFLTIILICIVVTIGMAVEMTKHSETFMWNKLYTNGFDLVALNGYAPHNSHEAGPPWNKYSPQNVLNFIYSYGLPVNSFALNDETPTDTTVHMTWYDTVADSIAYFDNAGVEQNVQSVGGMSSYASLAGNNTFSGTNTFENTIHNMVYLIPRSTEPSNEGEFIYDADTNTIVYHDDSDTESLAAQSWVTANFSNSPVTLSDSTGANTWNFRIGTIDGDLNISTQNNDNITLDGCVGIKELIPLAPLHIVGKKTYRGAYLSQLQIADYPGFFMEETVSNDFAGCNIFSEFFRLYVKNGAGDISASDAKIQISTATGYVAIGNHQPDTKLDVNGAATIRDISTDPSTPDTSSSAIWLSDGTGSGNDGDVMVSIKNDAGDERIGTLIDFSGFNQKKIVEKQADYTATSFDYIIIVSSSVEFTVTLPACATNTGVQYIIKNKHDSTAGEIEIDGNASENIDGANTISLTVANQAINLFCDGTEWHIW